MRKLAVELEDEPETETLTLLIWESVQSVPETCALYLIPNHTLSDSDLEILNAVHGHLLGVGDSMLQSHFRKILDAIAEDIKDLSPDCPLVSLWAQRWVKYKVDERRIGAIDNVWVTRVVRTGVSYW